MTEIDGADDGTLGGPQAMAIVALSGAFERVHYALVLAASQAALGKPCTIFFTLQACRALTRRGDDGRPGWAAMCGEDGTPAVETDATNRRRGVAGFEELLGACAALGVRFLVCEMGLRASDIEAADLRDDVAAEVTGAVTFFASVPADAAFLAL